jgi:hypothetical protein
MSACERLRPQACLPVISDRSHPPCSIAILENLGIPRRGFLCDGRLSVGDSKTGADCQGGELIDGVAAGAPVGELVFVEAYGHARMPFAGIRADHRAGIEPAAIDAHRAAEAAADLEGGLDDGVAREAWKDRLEPCDFPGRTAAGIPFLLVVRFQMRGLSVLYGIPEAGVPSRRLALPF